MDDSRMTLHLSSDQTAEAAALVRSGRLVVFPTETVYGLGANALDSAACLAVYAAKGRPADNPLIVHFPDVDSVIRFFPRLPDAAARLLVAFSPGPISVIVPRDAQEEGRGVADEATAGLRTVAVRVPSHPTARRFLAEAGVPVAAPSANRSGKPSPTTFAMARDAMDGRVDAIVDGGPCEVGLESTVVSVSGDEVRILRHGAVTADMISAALGGSSVVVDPEPTGAVHQVERPVSPGMKYTHYKPRATVLLTEKPSKNGWNALVDRARDCASSVHTAAMEGAHPRVGVIRVTDTRSGEDHGDVAGAVVVDMASLEEYAQRLYHLLVWFDAQEVDVIVAELPPSRGVGIAIRDRLLRASGGQRIE